MSVAAEYRKVRREVERGLTSLVLPPAWSQWLKVMLAMYHAEIEEER